MKEIPLTRGYVALVDDEDYDTLAQYKWHASTTCGITYAFHSFADGGRIRSVPMHRVIMSPTPDMQIDHVNHDGLDNRRENLRICTPEQNMHNHRRKVGKTGYRGVWKHGGKWQAVIKAYGKWTYLGTFLTPEQAALAWNKAVVDAGFAEYAVLNVVEQAK
jgi:hypothetical protein